MVLRHLTGTLKTWVQHLSLPQTLFMILDKLPNLLVPQVPVCKMGIMLPFFPFWTACLYKVQVLQERDCFLIHINTYMLSHITNLSGTPPGLVYLGTTGKQINNSKIYKRMVF